MSFDGGKVVPLWKPGESMADALSSARLNVPVDQLNRVTKYIGENLRQTYLNWNVVGLFVATIASSDHDDARYNLKISTVKRTLAQDDELDVEDDPISKSGTVIGTNLAEIGTDTHSLADDDSVVVFGFIAHVERSDSPATFYFFDRTPSEYWRTVLEDNCLISRHFMNGVTVNDDDDELICFQECPDGAPGLQDDSFSF